MSRPGAKKKSLKRIDIYSKTIENLVGIAASRGAVRTRGRRRPRVASREMGRATRRSACAVVVETGEIANASYASVVLTHTVMDLNTGK